MIRNVTIGFDPLNDRFPVSGSSTALLEFNSECRCLGHVDVSHACTCCRSWLPVH